MAIHERAIVDPAAQIADDVEIGPWSVIGPKVTVGAGTTIGPNVIIAGRTTIGRNNHIFQFNSIGDAPQDKKYAGEDTELVIGDGNTIREFCTINRGTVQDTGVTKIGDDNWIMAYVHIAHDCQLGDHIIMANNASLAGHVTIGNYAILSGFTQIHQFCDIGEHAFISFSSLVNRSVPPYVTVSPEKSHPRGMNTEGLRRRGFSAEQIQNVRRAYRILYRSGLPLDKAREELLALDEEDGEIRRLVDFIDHADRSIIR
ncbi:acyl-ACP--UDP-N-acetylglucosamine O-acyltransferase [Marinihelvus fidelis]|uniref:Acyl-[acyl-carrier-protein]--UDP-N-acetylglucosamine O-acyltransferase n=1 Tax=Marinihelvus fidelis TaxID=2613842 RepID=A0A5N0T3E9_9GAMM|nr:acyl-ACP--UDP-N-acetylglucosamine O-acyltransferase [Marinihelvus fidelis]KAA9129600.1 acyl-ACP--UDP-N-acetylglucosamine O-acyltransferase [Marinihelvus fidelis]